MAPHPTRWHSSKYDEIMLKADVYETRKKVYSSCSMISWDDPEEKMLCTWVQGVN
jgi:hypothetical protein